MTSIDAVHPDSDSRVVLFDLAHHVLTFVGAYNCVYSKYCAERGGGGISGRLLYFHLCECLYVLSAQDLGTIEHC